MAYGLKYLSEFYNTPPFKKLVSVQISKNGYSGAVTNVRTSFVQIQSNYQNDDTPVIGKGAKIGIIANSDDMVFLEDLLLSTEREFECVIEYDGVVAFRGFSICDLNERQLLPYAEILVEFTDYLHRTEGKYPSTLQPIGGVSNLMSIIQSILTATTLDFPLYVNSTLFEDSMDQNAGDTFLPQVNVQNSVFYDNSFDYDNIYDAINKVLKSFNAYLYSFKDNWIIERLEDVTRAGDWVSYNPNDFESDYDSEGVLPPGMTVASMRMAIDKQAGDFNYVNSSQIVEYDSGLHTLILKLRDKKLDSLIFNDWPSPEEIAKTPYYNPLAGTLEYRTWYIHEDFTDLSSGEDKNGINQWIHYTSSPTFVKGLCYNFAVYFNQDYDNDTVLTISYSQSTNQSMVNILRVGMIFFLRMDGGPYDNYLVKLSPLLSPAIPFYGGGEECINLISPSNTVYYNNNTHNDQEFVISEDGEKEKMWTLSKDFDFDTTPVRIYENNTTYTYHPGGLKALLGGVEYQKFNITFCSPIFSYHKTNYSIYEYTNLFDDVYLGDINVYVNAEEIENEITYVINKNFIKTKEVDLHLFDLKNLNYSNALLELDGFTRTNLWTSENSPIPIPLYEVFAKVLFRKYGRTIHRLKSKIKYDGILKPFTIITDNKIKNSDDETITFLLNTFTWDLNDGTYDIVADEYTEEEVIVDGVTYDSEGEPEWVDLLPPTPTGLTVVERNFIFHPLEISWDAVSGGVEGYYVTRRPYYTAGGVLVDSAKIIYAGNDLSCIDFPADMIVNTNSCTLYYRVASFRNDNSFSSLYSAEVSVNWTKY